MSLVPIVFRLALLLLLSQQVSPVISETSAGTSSQATNGDKSGGATKAPSSTDGLASTTETVSFSVGADGSIHDGVTGDVVQPSLRPVQEEQKTWWQKMQDYFSGKRKKKGPSTFLAPFPYLVKFFFFWWCALLLGAVFVIILDHLWLQYIRKRGAPVEWLCDFVVTGVKRSDIWTQLVDVPLWDDDLHPTLQHSSLVGERKKLDQPGIIIRLCAKVGDFSEDERRATLITRRVVAVEPNVSLTMETVSEPSGNFTSLSKMRLKIDLDDNPVEEASDEGEKKKVGQNSANTTTSGVRVTVSGSGETYSRVLAWCFNLASAQEQGVQEYFDGLKACCIKNKELLGIRM
ncbi:unnamed protein product [Amoebophrya sp. A25]|nr:unnamed protein product [Amoebophrya sp. A25]|eukprot:GSA25T00005469001.1